MAGLKPGTTYGVRLALVALVCASVGVGAQAPADRPEAGSAEAIARFTTEARFLSPWVASVPASDTVPSPTKYWATWSARRAS